MSLFSGVNQLEDITLDVKYGTICGYTHADLENQFGEHLKGVDQKQIKRWYNGCQLPTDTFGDQWACFLGCKSG